MNRVFKRWSLSTAVMAATLAVSGAAMAQDEEGGGGGGMTLPQQAAAAPGDSDHGAMVGRLGVGFLGRRDMLIASDESGGQATTAAPVIGIRYWLDELLGLDAGIGLSLTGGSTTVEAGGQSVEADKAGVTTFIIHGGVPLSLAADKHFSFQVVPELNVGFASSTVSPPPPPGGGQAGPDLELSGFHVDVGVRAGAEIHFGFIDIPQLALQGSVGLRFDIDNTKGTLKSSPQTSAEDSSTRFATNVGSNPWAIFTNSVAALYYF